MLYMNRYGVWMSRPWRPLSARPHPRLVTLLVAFPSYSKYGSQARAYEAARAA